MTNAKRITEADSFVGTRIRARRLAMGLSQEKLAAALGLTFQQVQKYEKGTNRVGAGRLAKIAETLGCSIMDFYPTGGTMPGVVSDADSLLATKDGARLVRAMLTITDEQARSTLIDLAEAMARLSSKPAGKAATRLIPRRLRGQ